MDIVIKIGIGVNNTYGSGNPSNLLSEIDEPLLTEDDFNIILEN